MTTWTIDRPIHKLSDRSDTDWFGWLRTEIDGRGLYVQVQIGFQASEDQANAILNEFAHPEAQP